MGRIARDRTAGRRRRGIGAFRPRLEDLEARCVPTAEPVPGYGQVPLAFEANHGQTDTSVNFLAHGPGYGLFLLPTEAVLSLQSGPATATLQMRLVGGNPSARPEALGAPTSVSNYIVGSDPTQWHTNVPDYAQVEYHDVYPGIDLVYYGSQQQLEYDFQVAPGAEPGAIHLAFDGVQGLALDTQGNLVLHTAAGDVTEHAPVLYQQAGGVRQPVAGHYVLEGGNQVSFAVGAYDRTRPLVIDPVLVYSTYLGGSGSDVANGIAVDRFGYAYVTGYTQSPNFPLASPVEGFKGRSMVFVTKLTPSGTGVVYSTYLGGSGGDQANGIALDAAGHVYLAGNTLSADFPVVNGSQSAYQGGGDGFAAVLNNTGSGLVYSTYLGGSNFDRANGIAVDPDGNAYVVGQTESTDLPTAGPFQASLQGTQSAFVTKLTAAGALSYSTYLGANSVGQGIAVGTDRSAYVTGRTSATDFPLVNPFQSQLRGDEDAFVSKLTPAGNALAYSTYLGGTSADSGNAIAVDTAGYAYVTGQSFSTDFPLASPIQSVAGVNPHFRVFADAFITKLTPAGNGLVFSTYEGGHQHDFGTGVAVDAAGDVFVTGFTTSTDFPVANAIQPTIGGGNATNNVNGGISDAFLTEYSPTGTSYIYSTFLGGTSNDYAKGIALDAAGNAYIAGLTSSTDFPTASPFQPANAGGNDAFVAKVGFNGLLPGERALATGADAGGGPQVNVYDAATGDLKFAFMAYSTAFTGGVRVAVRDVNGDGIPDIITAPGPGGGPDIRVFDGGTGTLVREFMAYDPRFTGGVFVAAADLNGDGRAEIITAPNSGGGPDVRVFDGLTGTLTGEFMAYAPSYQQGVRLAAGDVTGDGTPDIITAPGPNMAPDVRVFDGKTLTVVRDFLAYDSGFLGGVYVAAGDTNGDGFADIITGAGSGGGPHVKVFSGKDSTVLASFFAFDPSFTGGVRVGFVGDLNGDGKGEIVTGAGPGDGPQVKVFDGTTLAVLDSFFAYDSRFAGGVFVGGR